MSKKKINWDDKPDFTRESDVELDSDDATIIPETVVEPVNEQQPALPLIPLEVFCKLSGKKPDQIAGFRRYALSNQLKPKTIPEWREELIAFQNKPMQ